MSTISSRVIEVFGRSYDREDSSNYADRFDNSNFADYAYARGYVKGYFSLGKDHGFQDNLRLSQAHALATLMEEKIACIISELGGGRNGSTIRSCRVGRWRTRIL